MSKLNSPEWIGLILSILTMGIGVTSFSYSTFVLKDIYKDDKKELSARLMRIEDKIDRLLIEKR